MYLTPGNFPTYHKLLVSGPLTQKCAHVKCYKEVSLICERTVQFLLKE